MNLSISTRTTASKPACALAASATSGVRWTSLSSAINAASDVARTVVLAHFLMPADYGLMAMGAVVIGFAQMYIDLGVSAAVVHRQDTTNRELSSLYWLNILVGLAVFGTVWLCAPLAPVFFREPRVLPLLRWMAVVFLIVPIGSQFETLLQKELMFQVLAGWEIVASLTGTVVAIVCAAAGFGVWTLVFSFLSNVTVKTCLLCRIGFARFRPSFHFKRSDLNGYLSFGLFQMGERSINYLAERLDQLLIGPLLGAQALGFYTFALYLTAQPVSRINPILTRVAFPVFSRLQNDPERLRRGYLKLVRFIATVNAPLLIGLAAIAPWAIPSVFGRKWAGSVLLVQILCFVSLSRSIGNPIGSLQLAKGRADLGFWWNLLLFVSTLPAIYLGGKLGQTTGVAVALLVLHVCINVPSYLLMVKPLIGGCARAYIGATLKPIAFAGAMGAVVIFLPALSVGLPQNMQIALQVAIGALIYVSLLHVINKDAIAEFRGLLFGRRPVGNSAAA